MKRIAIALILMAGQAAAHPGAHAHPHDGASWLTMVAALAVLGAAGGVAFATWRRRK